MIGVWGGVGAISGTYLDTGGRYDPATDSWTTTSTTGAPEERYYHTAVWSAAAEMMIGGGYGDVSGHHVTPVGDTTPATDSWIATGVTERTDVSYQHTAVWTDNEMIVWGGYSPFNGYLNTGGAIQSRYRHLDSNQHTNAPEPRYYHTAIWTGAEMIPWGGYDVNAAPTLTPAGDTQSVKTAGQQPARRQPRLRDAIIHTAVWTGSETMIVWGGYGVVNGYGVYFNTGGKILCCSGRLRHLRLQRQPRLQQ